MVSSNEPDDTFAQHPPATATATGTRVILSPNTDNSHYTFRQNSVNSVTNVSSMSSFSTQNSTAQLVTISHGSISLPLVGSDQSGSSISTVSVYSSPESLPTLMSPRDQMMSSTMIPRDQMLSSQTNSKPISFSTRKDQILTSSADQLLSPMMSPTDAIISSPSQISSLSVELLGSSHNQPNSSQNKDDPMSTLSSPQLKDPMMQNQCQQVRDQSLMSPLLSPQDSLPLSPSLGRDQLGPLSPNSPLQLPPPSPLPSQQESWDDDKSSKSEILIISS